MELYYDEFEKSRGQILKKLPSLTEEYFLENFIGGLQGEIKGMLRLLEPSTLEQALKHARYYEQTLASQPKKGISIGGHYKSGVNYQTQVKASTAIVNHSQTAKGSFLTPIAANESDVINSKPKPLTYSQREDRRQKGLCFYCDDKFTKGNECKKPQSFLMVSDDTEREIYDTIPKYYD